MYVGCVGKEYILYTDGWVLTRNMPTNDVMQRGVCVITPCCLPTELP